MFRWVHSIKGRRAPKVFGVGYPKTGTTTLATCLAGLGYKHKTCDMNLAAEVRSGRFWRTIGAAERYDSFDDWPWFLVFREMSELYPEARFILTVRRSTEAYLGSLRRYREHRGRFNKGAPEPDWWRPVFGFPMHYWNAERFAEEYESHNEAVVNWFANEPERLKVLCWENGDEWDELCSFLDKETPDQPFPHLNRTQ